MKTQKNTSLDIFLYCDGAEFDGSTLGKKSLGGSETAGLQIAKELSDLGNNVTVFAECTGSNTSPGIYDGVRYVNHEKYSHMSLRVPHDVNIVSRRHQLLNSPKNSKINILWNQDHAWFDQKKDLLNSIWNADSIFTLTEFHKNQQSGVWGLPDDFFWIAGNGIDLDLISRSTESITQRDPNKLIYASRPERGLDVLLTQIWPQLLKSRPQLKLYITTYDFFPPQIVNLLNQLKSYSNQFGDSVVWLPPLTKKELYEQFASSSLYLYPTAHKEGYCILAAEAMACGLPIVANGIGALTDVVDSDAGVLLSGFNTNNNPEFCNQFVLHTLELLNNKAKWERMSCAGKSHAKSLGWKDNAKRWDSKFRKMIQERFFGKKQSVQRESLSVILTTKNDEDYIQGCLDSVKEIADEIIVADLGSTDSTLDLLKEYKCKVLKNDFDISLLGYEQPRNECLKKADGEWILWLNPKDKLINGNNLEKYLRHNPWDGYSIKHKFVQDNHLLDSFFDSPPMLFRNNGKIKFKGMVLERPEELNKDKIGSILDVSILNTDTNANGSYYYANIFPLLERDRIKYPGRQIGMVTYMSDLMFIATSNINKGISKDIAECCKRVVDLFESNFVGSSGVIADAALSAYSNANNILGTGIDVVWNLGFSKKTEASNGDTKRARFSSVDVFQDHINPIIVKQSKNVTGEWTLP
jgi:glycosyltransferase involved in cell wall biosynthesis